MRKLSGSSQGCNWLASNPPALMLYLPFRASRVTSLPPVPIGHGMQQALRTYWGDCLEEALGCGGKKLES